MMMMCARRAMLALVLAGVTAGTALAVGPDLNVTLIERTPRYSYHDTKDKPDAGETITFHGHIRYWGDANSQTLPSVGYKWFYDGQIVDSGTITNFEPLKPPYTFDYTGYNLSNIRDATSWPYNVEAYDPANPPTGWRVVTYSMPMPDYPDFDSNNPVRPTIKLVVDTAGQIAESSESNNQREDYIHALIGGFWVEESMWRYFHENQWRLNVASNSWEDWIQRHMDRQNQMYAAAIYPEISPIGILDRVRVGRIIVVPDGTLPLTGGSYGTNWPDRYDYTIDIMWGFLASQTPPGSTFYSDVATVSNDNPFYFEKSLLHELGHARYLIDHYGYDVHNTAHNGGHDSVQICEGGTFVANDADSGYCTGGGVYVGGSSYLPYVAFGEVLYYNQTGGVMTGPYGFNWSPGEAGALNRIAGERACCGHYNAPSNLGEYVNDLPQNNHYQFVDAHGMPRPGASIEVYRSVASSGYYGKTFDDTPDAFFTADANGYVNLGRNPFSTSALSPWHSNTVMILRIEHTGTVWYRFVESALFNIEYWKGNTQDAYYTMALDGPNVGDTDGDGLLDDWELQYFNTLVYGANADVEPDGLQNWEEQDLLTDPNDPDTDDDNLSDGVEVDSVGTNPLVPDTDEDDVDDGDDNCPLDYNADQQDGDFDGIGDVCDPLTDCNLNGTPDADELAAGAPDCNANGIIDTCELVEGVAADCNANGLLDECDFASGTSDDCNANGTPDECDVERPAPYLVDDQPAIRGWIEIANINNALNLGPDEIGTATLPFTNALFTNPALVVANDGAVGFGGAASLPSVNEPLPTASVFGGAQALVPYWDDLDADTGDVYFKFTFPAVAVVQWDDRAHQPATPGLFGDEATFEVQIYQSPYGNVYAQMLYQDTFMRNAAYNDGASATVGYQHNGTSASQCSFNVPGGVTDATVLSLVWDEAVSADENGDSIPDECQVYATGDLNCDGVVDTYDIDAFVTALTGQGNYEAAYPGCDFMLADCNGDEIVDTYDIDAFVGLLAGS